MSRVTAEGLGQQYSRGNLLDILRGLTVQVNRLTEGRIAAKHNAATSIPTSGSYAQGDIIANSTPSESSTVGSKYIVTGWICVVSGEPGTFKEMRVLTGG